MNLYFGANLGGDPLLFYQLDDGATDYASAVDDLPESLLDEIDGWCVFEGVIRKPTPEEDPNDEFRSWYDGKMRPATAEEVVAFFDLKVQHRHGLITRGSDVEQP